MFQDPDAECPPDGNIQFSMHLDTEYDCNIITFF